MKKQKRTSQRSPAALFFAHIAISLADGTIAAALLFSGLAALRCQWDIAPQLLSPIATAALSMAVMFSGLILAMLRREKGLLYGLLMGGCFYMALWIAALSQGQTEFSALSVIKGMVLLCSGTMGGFFGILLGERRRVRR